MCLVFLSTSTRNTLRTRFSSKSALTTFPAHGKNKNLVAALVLVLSQNLSITIDIALDRVVNVLVL